MWLCVVVLSVVVCGGVEWDSSNPRQKKHSKLI